MILATLWSAALTLLGAWWGGTGLISGAVWGIVAGLGGWLLALLGVHLAGRRPDQTLATVASGLTAVLVLGATLGPTLPSFRQSLELSSTPVDMQVRELQDQGLTLPQYVRLHGRLIEDLAIYDTYLVRRSSDTTGPQVQRVVHTPVVGEAWQAGEPVPVVTTALPEVWQTFETDSEGLQAITGVLYPLVPGPDEQAWPGRGSLVGTLQWYQSQAQFNFEPDQFYILDATSPLQMRLPLFIMVGVLVIAGVIVMAVLKRRK